MITYSDVKYDCDSGSIHRSLPPETTTKERGKEKKKEGTGYWQKNGTINISRY